MKRLIHSSQNLISKLLFDNYPSALKMQVCYFVKQFFPYNTQCPSVPIVFAAQTDIQFINNQILIPEDLLDQLTTALEEHQENILNKIKEQTLVALFLATLATIAPNKNNHIAHVFTAQALTRCFIQRRNGITTIEKTPANFTQDETLIPIFNSTIGQTPQQTIINIKKMADTLVYHAINNIPLYKIPESASGMSITPAMLYSAQILGLDANGFNVPPFETTRAKRALTKCSNALFKNQLFSATKRSYSFSILSSSGNWSSVTIGRSSSVIDF